MSCPTNFNWRYYLDTYSDLQNAGLKIPTHFDWEFYLNHYTDLQNAGIINREQAITHYLTHGYKENRFFTPHIPSDFNWRNYFKNYNDLRKNGINTFSKTIEHYITHGKDEGRNYKDILKDNLKAVLCAIAFRENLYLDEWIQYHLKLGFSKIVIYDNSPENEAQYFENKYDRVQIIYFPGFCAQIDAYSHFIKYMKDICEYEWGGFIDLDEFIVLKNHKTIIDLLMEHCSEGSLSLNWVLFGSNGQTEYKPEPVTKRFIRRSKYINHHIKSLFCIDDVSSVDNPHFVNLSNGNQHDCHGHVFKGPFNMLHPSITIACVHHYFTKTWEEYLLKMERGEADRQDSITNPKHNKKFFDTHDQNDIIDTSAWDFFNSSS